MWGSGTVLTFVAFLDAVLTAQNSPASKTCTTASCWRIGLKIYEVMNESVDPCEDFHEYACGNWPLVNPIPDEERFYDTFSLLERKVEIQLRETLEADGSDDISSARNKARKLYSTCVDLDKIEEDGMNVLLPMLDDLLGGWPVVTPEWDDSKFNWLRGSSQFMPEDTMGALLRWGVQIDADNASQRVIDFQEPSLILGRSGYISENLEFKRVAYKKLMGKWVEILNEKLGLEVTEDDEKRVKKELNDVLNFETFLANISRTEEERRDVKAQYTKMTLLTFHSKYLSEVVSLSDLVHYMQDVMPTDALKSRVTKETVINVQHPPFFEKLGKFLHERLATPAFKRILANFFGVQILWSYGIGSSSKLIQAYWDYQGEVTGTMKQDAQWIICANFVNKVLKKATGSLYIQRYFSEEAKIKVTQMISRLKDSLRVMIENVEWMDEPTRSKAIEKVKDMMEYVGYTDYLMNDIPKLDKEHEDLTMSEIYAENLANINRFTFVEKTKGLGELHNRSIDEYVSPAEVNAAYSMEMHIIVMMAGILQGHFYGTDRPEYLNYAGIGSMIGHEMTHAFDDMGSLFDGQGNLKNWWSNESRTHFNEKATAMVEKYNGYALPEGKVNGFLTLGENIADLGGLKAAFQAYKTYTKDLEEPEMSLPGFGEFSTNQMFFLAFAQNWCGIVRPKMVIDKLQADNHSPPKFRVNGPLSSLPEFAESFSCPTGSPMNPPMKVSVW